ncbi:MAG TPA: alpha/beta hydrolase [Bryobacteraceae bacterium]
MSQTMRIVIFSTFTAAAGFGLFAQTTPPQPEVAGDWQGTLKAGGAEFRLILHVAKSSSGALTATLDSIDQGAKGIPAGTVTVEGSNLRFAIESIQGTYEGKLNSDATSIDGTWTQGQPFPLVLTRMAAKAAGAVAPSDIDGAWMGTLDVGTKLRIVFHFVNTSAGLTATLDSPDQGAKGLPVPTVTRDGSSIKLGMPNLGATFDGKIAADRSTIEGTFTQGGNSLPLVLKPSTGEVTKVEHHRPQNPVRPYPYRDEDVIYKNQTAGIDLGATLTVPQGRGPFPAVVLITGSGQQDRDESLLGHKPFLVLADYLTRQGIVVLRVDDRGAGKSGGNFAASTTRDFATDVEAGISFLKTRTEVNPLKIGLIGHSEGGLIAPMVAARNPSVAFIVMMAGPGVPGDQILPAQIAAIMEANGASHEEAMKHAQNEREVLTLAEHGASAEELEKKLFEIDSKVPQAQRMAQIKALDSPWFKFFISHDPAGDLRKVKCPVLAINGEKDRQVPPDLNLPAIRKALTAGGNQHFEVEELPGLNHLFQTAKTGSPSEYADIDETISPAALKLISSWILKQ